MRTNIVLDDELVEQALQYAGVKTKRELVERVLCEFVEDHRRQDVRELRGMMPVREEYSRKRLRTGQ